MSNPSSNGNATRKKMRATAPNISKGSRIFVPNLIGSGVIIGKSTEQDGTCKVAIEGFQIYIGSHEIELADPGVVVLPLGGQRLKFIGATEEDRERLVYLVGEKEANQMIATQVEKASGPNDSSDQTEAANQESADQAITDDSEVVR